MAFCVIYGFACILCIINPQKFMKFDRLGIKSSEYDNLKKISGISRPKLTFMTVEEKTIKDVNNMRNVGIMGLIILLFTLTWIIIRFV